MKWVNNVFSFFGPRRRARNTKATGVLSLDHEEQIKTRRARIRNADEHEELTRTLVGYSAMLSDKDLIE